MQNAAESEAAIVAAAMIAPANAAATTDLVAALDGKKFKILVKCLSCGHEQSPNYDVCQRCDDPTPEKSGILQTKSKSSRT